MDVNQANILNDTTIRGSIRFGASRFIGTIPAIGPNKMFVKYETSISPEQLPGISHTPYQGGYIIDFGENWDGIIKDDYRQATIIGLVFPSNTKEIQTGAFATLIVAPPDEAISIVIPGSVEIIAEGAFADCVMKMCTIEDGEATLNIDGYAFTTTQIGELNILKRNAEVIIKENAFQYMRYVDVYAEKQTEVNLPVPSAKKITIASNAFIQAEASINVPSVYSTESTIAKVEIDSFQEVYNVNYSGEDTAAPWGAYRLNGKEI